MKDEVKIKIVLDGSDQVKREFESLAAGVKRTAGEISSSLGNIGGFKTFEAGIGNMKKGIGGVADKLTALSVAGAAGLLALGKKSLDAASQFEVGINKYETLLGSLDAAKERVAEITDFAARTPFEQAEITKADIILQGFGIRSRKILEQVGNAAAISGSGFDELALVIGQLSQSKDLENIKQLVERGVISFGELRNAGIKFDKSGAIVNSVDETFSAVIGIIDKKFAGGMDKLSNTLPGRISTLSDAINIGLGKVAQESGLLDFAKDAVAALSEQIGKVDFSALGAEIKKFLPSFKDVARTAKEFLTPIIEFIRNNPELIKSLLDIGAKLVALNLALKTGKMLFGDIGNIVLGLGQTTFPLLRTAVTTIGPAIVNVATSFGGTLVSAVASGVGTMVGAVGSFGSALASLAVAGGPILLVVAALGAAIAAAVNLANAIENVISAEVRAQQARAQSASLQTQTTNRVADFLRANPQYQGKGITDITKLNALLRTGVKVNKFAQGGIVPGTSFSGDNVMARVNSGEMILTSSQQAKLFKMLSGGMGNKTVNVNGNISMGGSRGETQSSMLLANILTQLI